MSIQLLDSVKSIERQYLTGEEPVLVLCSDMNAYICKYMRSSFAAYKLACELVGAQMAKAWHLDTPEIAFVRIRPSHWPKGGYAALSIGSRKLEGVVDITPSTYRGWRHSSEMAKAMPTDWNVPSAYVEKKTGQLFESEWVDGVWSNFMECFTENIGK